MRILAFLLTMIAAPALADIQTSVQADLNGNGAAETFELLVDEANLVTLSITEEGAVPIKAEDFTWQGGLYGQEAELELAANGSVRVISQNEGCCRHRWRQTLTLAYRAGGIRVAGLTYFWRDTLDLDDFGTCDVNFLTGRGVIEQGDQPAMGFGIPNLAPLVTDWSTDTPLPDVCALD